MRFTRILGARLLPVFLRCPPSPSSLIAKVDAADEIHQRDQDARAAFRQLLEADVRAEILTRFGRRVTREVFRVEAKRS